MDQVRALQVFVAVVELGSFKAAAEQHNLSRTATSKLIMDLEARLGTSLLQRTTRTVNPTQAGLAYFERAHSILDQLSEANQEASESTRRLHGKVRIAAPLSFGIRHIAPKLAQFSKAHPEVKLDFILSDMDSELVEERIDLAVRIGALSDSSLIARRISTSQILLCASPAYLTEHGEPKQIEDLKHHICHTFPYRSGHKNWQLHHAQHGSVLVPIEHTIWSNNGEAILSAAVEGSGIILQPDFIVSEAIRSGSLKVILPEYRGDEIPIQLVYPRAPYMPLRTRLLMDFLAETIGQDNAWAIK